MGLKIGWLLVGPRSIPSARIEGYNLHNWLNANGQESSIIYAPYSFNQSLPLIPPLTKKYDVVVFQKVFAGMADQAMLYYKMQGVKIIYYVTDLVQGMDSTIFYSDRTIMSAPYTFNFIMQKHRNKIVILKDAYESPKDFHKTKYETDEIKVLWFGTNRIFDYVEKIATLIESYGFRVVMISDHPKADKQWKEKEIHKEIKDSDIVILPSPLDQFAMCKDENRLVQSMVIGIPCVASPIPAYVDLYDKFDPHPFILTDNSEKSWLDCVAALEDPMIRKNLGEYGRKCVIEDYNIDNIGQQFLEILKKEVYNDQRS